MLASSLSNPFIVGAYLDDNKYHDSANGWAELVTTILTLLILLISIAASVIPAIVESNRKLVKNLNKRKKRDVK
jgi:predicted PurR-regulated permease PerM